MRRATADATVTGQFPVVGQTAAPTGGTKGVGRAVAGKFVADGASPLTGETVPARGVSDVVEGDQRGTSAHD